MVERKIEQKNDKPKLTPSQERPELGPKICGFCGGTLFISNENSRISVCKNYDKCGYSYDLEKHCRRLKIKLPTVETAPVRQPV